MSNMKFPLSYQFIVLGLILNIQLFAIDCLENLTTPNGPIEVCENGFATFKADSVFLNADDALGYIMLDNSAGVPINYLTYNNTGYFSQGAAYSDTPYYLFVVIGPDDDGDELPDLNNQNVNICGGTEIIFSQNLFPTEDYYCYEDTIETTLINVCGNSAGKMSNSVYNVCYGDFGVALALDFIIEQDFHLRYILHDSASADSLGNIIAINETGIFYNSGTLPNNQDLFVSAYVGPLDNNNNPVLEDTCASIALPGAPLRFFEAIELVVVDQNTIQNNGTEFTFYITGGAPAFQPNSDFLEYLIEGDYSGVAQPYEEITYTTFQLEYEIEVVNDGKVCSQYFSELYSIDTLLNVWPGDVNRNGIVNNEDFALMGLYINETGPARSADHQNISWDPHPAEDWNGLHNNQINLKHFDCNGDGIIDSLDIEAIRTNYSLQHDEELEQAEIVQTDSITYQVLLLPVGEITNDSLTINVDLINENGGLLNLQGAYFTINYNFLLQAMDVVDFNFLPNSWLDTKDNKLYTISQHFESTQSIEVGFTKTDGNNSVGEGTIGQLIFTFEDQACCNSDAFDIPTLEIHTAKANNIEAEFIPIPNQLLQINSGSLNDTNDCKSNWLITTDVPFQNVYKSTGALETEGELYIGAQQLVSYQAINITLNNGFKLKEGAFFHAGKSNCTSGGAINTESED